MFKSFLFNLIPGSQHSGAYEDDFNASSNDLDGSQQETNNENNNDHIEDDDVDGIDSRCSICDRQCSDIDQWVKPVWFSFNSFDIIFILFIVLLFISADLSLFMPITLYILCSMQLSLMCYYIFFIFVK